MMKFRTDVCYSWMDLVVGFGGILGLFFGCSLISGVEIVYFSTIALFYQYKRSRGKLVKKIKSKFPFLNWETFFGPFSSIVHWTLNSTIYTAKQWVKKLTLETMLYATHTARIYFWTFEARHCLLCVLLLHTSYIHMFFSSFTSEILLHYHLVWIFFSQSSSATSLCWSDRL